MWWQESNVLEHWILDVGGKPVSFSQTQSQLLSTSTIIRYHKSHKYSTSCQIQINVDPTTKDKCLQLNIEYPHICIYIYIPYEMSYCWHRSVHQNGHPFLKFWNRMKAAVDAHACWFDYHQTLEAGQNCPLAMTSWWVQWVWYLNIFWVKKKSTD